MTKTEALAYVGGCNDEYDGPDSFEEACELFTALYGRQPDAEDGTTQVEIWSHCCSFREEST